MELFWSLIQLFINTKCKYPACLLPVVSFAAKHLFVGSYLQVTWWALGQWNGRKKYIHRMITKFHCEKISFAQSAKRTTTFHPWWTNAMEKTRSPDSRTTKSLFMENKILLFKDTVVLRQWDSQTRKFAFIKRVDKSRIITVKDLEKD